MKAVNNNTVDNKTSSEYVSLTKLRRLLPSTIAPTRKDDIPEAPLHVADDLTGVKLRLDYLTHLKNEGYSVEVRDKINNKTVEYGLDNIIEYENIRFGVRSHEDRIEKQKAYIKEKKLKIQNIEDVRRHKLERWQRELKIDHYPLDSVKDQLYRLYASGARLAP